eukprot:2157835-Prymnesium_polylepis.1
MADAPYSSWNSLWVHAPDPTCSDSFTGTTKDDTWGLLDTCFFSPEATWPHLGIRTPCAIHGWEHASHVRVHSTWRQRLVKGMVTDFCIAGQQCRCLECARLKAVVRKRYAAAKSARVRKAELGKLKS